MREVKLLHGEIALIDDEDYERVSQYRWYAHNKKTDHTLYARSSMKIDGVFKTALMHRFIMNLQDGERVDHRNRNGLDNQKSNLRRCTNQQNSHNSKFHKTEHNTSRYKGICFLRNRNAWSARIVVNYKSIYIGYYKDETDAARAYDAKARELFGEFAFLNFPDS
jgi:hypothetical protein